MTERVLFVIPARGGSRRIPGKNVRTLAGIPLVAWAVRVARAAARPGDVVVCSTDDAGIAAAAAPWGAIVLDRPADLATDTATSMSVVRHALDAIERSHGPIARVVLVQPTSPLTDAGDLAAGIETARTTGRSVASVAVGRPSTWQYRRDDDGTLRLPSSDGAPSHVLTGAFYVVDPAAIRRGHGFVEPGVTIGQVISADRAIDVDEPEDLLTAAAILRARPVTPLTIEGRVIGGQHVFVIAEAGVNHDGDIDRAHALIDAAAATGADAVKFQTFVPAALAATTAPTATYQRERDGADAQRTMLERLALPDEAWAALQAHARALGIVFLSTPFDDASAVLLDRLDVPAFKVGSGELTNLPFLARLSRMGRPLIVSTGMATMVEVAAAVDAIRASGPGRGLALLHCVSSYPAAPADANLAAIAMLRDAFGAPAGWSDHTLGIELAIAAVASGASILEKHLTLDRASPGPDHAMSLEPAEFMAMVAAIRATEAAIGGHDKSPTRAEREIAAIARRSLHWARDLDAGAPIAASDLVALRPGTGISPSQLEAWVGRHTARPVTSGSMVDEADA